MTIDSLFREESTIQTAMRILTCRYVTWISLLIACACPGTNAVLSRAADTGFNSTGASAIKSFNSNAFIEFRQKLMGEHIPEPQAVVPLSQHSALVAERSGGILYFHDGSGEQLGPIAVAGEITSYDKKPTFSNGLKDLIAMPGSQDRFAWCMTTSRNQEIRWSVGLLQLTSRRSERATMHSSLLWQSEPLTWTKSPLGPFFGCRLAFDGKDIVVATGAVDRHEGSGKIVKISVNHSHAPVLISTGHRNPSGILVVGNTTWETEYGPVGGDELNVIVPGADYGWPTVSVGKPQEDGQPEGTGTLKHFVATKEGSVDPIKSWSPSINPSGLTELNNKLYVSTLKGAILELTISNGQIVSERPVLELHERIRDVRVNRASNSLLVLTDGPDARLLSLDPVE